MSTTKVVSTLALALSLAMLGASETQATPISGEIFFTGTGTLKLGAANSTPLLADGIDFNSPVQIEENVSSGDYAGLAATTTTSFTDLIGASAFGVVGTTGTFLVDPFWQFTDANTGKTYAFRLTTVTDNTTSGSGSGIARVVAGTGVASITGLDDTIGTWQLSTSGSRASISFSSVTVVPDGGATISLLGLALLGVGAARRIPVGKLYSTARVSHTTER